MKENQKFIKISDEENRIGKAIVNCAYKLHRDLGPGLLEKVYEICMAYLLEKEGFSVKRQCIVPIKYEGLT